MPTGPARFLPWLFALGLPACALLAPTLLGDELGPFWLWPAIGAALGALLLVLRPTLPTGVLIGAGLLALSGFFGQRAGPSLSELGKSSADEVAFYDLTEGPLPDDAAGRVRVRGHLIAEPKLDEYAVAPGLSPDQNTPPVATVRLFLPTPEFAIPNEGRYLAARIPSDYGSERQNGADLVEGELRPLPEALIDPIFGGNAVPEGVGQGMLLDAGVQARKSDVVIDLAMSLIAALLALLSIRSAFAREPEETPATS